MFHQIPFIGKLEHPDHKKYSGDDKQDGYGIVPDNGSGRKHQDTGARGGDPDKAQVADLSLVKQAGDYR